jgi:chitinase
MRIVFMRRIALVLALIAVILVSALVTFGNPTPTQARHFKVIAYMPSWAGDINTMQYSKLTHINYAFLLPNSNGSLQAIENPSKLQALVSKAHANGVKVLISVGGWNGGNDSAFETFAASSTGRTTFTNNMVNFMNQYGLDGVDIDWEYPDPGTSGTNYAALMSQLASAMHSRGKLLTAAVVSGGTQGGGVPSGVFSSVDFLNLMAYDGDGGAGHSPYSLAQSSINYWRGRGLPASKTVLGVPFYARPSWASYSALLAAGCSADSDTCNYQGQTNYYNGRPTMRQKTDLAMQNGGIMYWEDSQDTRDSRSLLSAIYSRMHGTTGPTPTKTNTPRPVPTNTPGGTSPTRTPTKAPTTSGTTAWAPNVSYSVNQLVTYGGHTYKCIQAHTSLVGWEPPNVPALWGFVS